MENILYIDTSSNQEIIVSLKIDGKEYALSKKSEHQKAQVVLPMIETLLKKHNLSYSDLSAIEVHPGPGSFTGLRVGVAIANTLGLVLNVPVNGKKVGEMVEPRYE